MDLYVLRASESEKVIFGMSFACLSVCGHYNLKNNWASSTKFGMSSYDKNLGWDCIRAKSASGCGLCRDSTIRFFGEKCLKNALYNNFFQTKVATNHNRQLLVQNFFWSHHVCGLCPDSTIQFLAKSSLKMRCTNFFCQTKAVQNQNPQLLCRVTFFDIFHHNRVIAASQICSVCWESIVPSYGTDFFPHQFIWKEFENAYIMHSKMI